MTHFTKPDMRRAWCNNGSKVQPNNAKIDSGWIAEKPPYQSENWLQNRADVYLQHLDERGAPNWDPLVIYSKGSRIFNIDQHWQSLQNSNLGNPVTAGLGWWIPVRELENPVGVITIWPIDGAPVGSLQCNGANVSQAAYPRLYSFLGQMYGGDASGFVLPDYRGYTLRGTDNGRGIDPDAISRTNRGDGTTGDEVGTIQQDAFKSHGHGYNNPNKPFADGWVNGGNNRNVGDSAETTGLNGGNETRMKNINVNFVISY